MPEKRKDRKGRVLKAGESQRTNGSYEYRYVDVRGKRRSAYAKTLEELRKKEENILCDQVDGIDYAAGEATVMQLVEHYLNLKTAIKKSTAYSYNVAVNRIKLESFSERRIKDVKLSDCKALFVSLHDKGLKQNTLKIVQAILKPAFELAVDDDIIRKNPFKFKISDVVPDDACARVALTKEQQQKYLKTLEEYGNHIYNDDIIILLETGMRVSELYGLTKDDIDFENQRIYVRRQMGKRTTRGDNRLYISETKTKGSIRCIPMSATAHKALRRVIERRLESRVEPLIDGISGFLFLNKTGTPRGGIDLDKYMKRMQNKCFEALGKSFPRVTPHVLRHTFCTNMQQAGIDVKSLQYLMGHSNVSTTLNIYSHMNFEVAERAFQRAMGDSSHLS